MIVSFVLFCHPQDIVAQDYIFLKVGNDIEAIVLTISENEIQYKKYNNLDGPIYTINKEKIVMIKYQNGSKDIFNNSSPINLENQINKIEENIYPTNSNNVTIKSNYTSNKALSISNEEARSGKIRTLGFGYIPVYQGGISSGFEGGLNLGLSLDNYTGRLGKLGFGINSVYNIQNYSDDVIDYLSFTMALGLGPGTYILADEKFRLWIGANGGGWYTIGSVRTTLFGNETNEEIADFGFYYNVSIMATLFLSPNVGVYAKGGYSNFDMFTLGICWTPKK